MQETWIRSLAWDAPTCCEAAKPEHRDSWGCALEPGAATAEAYVPRACALQQEKPQAARSQCTDNCSPHSLQLEKKSVQPKINNKIILKMWYK